MFAIVNFLGDFQTVNNCSKKSNYRQINSWIVSKIGVLWSTMTVIDSTVWQGNVCGSVNYHFVHLGFDKSACFAPEKIKSAGGNECSILGGALLYTFQVFFFSLWHEANWNSIILATAANCLFMLNLFTVFKIT